MQSLEDLPLINGVRFPIKNEVIGCHKKPMTPVSGFYGLVQCASTVDLSGQVSVPKITDLSFY